MTLRPLHHRLATGITFLAVAHSLLAQDITIIHCDGTAVGEVYCYVNNDDHSWHWQSECYEPLTLQFTAGSIEANDQLMMFDGPDALSPLLYMNPQDVDLSGSEFYSTGSDLFMVFTSDPTNCCATDGLLGTQSAWVWSVSSGTVGIHEEQVGDLAIFPNPAVTNIHLRLPHNAMGPAEIRILDVSGREMYHTSFTTTPDMENTFDLHGLQCGTYCVVLTTASGVKVQRLQVMR